MKKFFIVFAFAIVSVFIIALIVGAIFISCTPTGREMWNGYQNTLKKADDRSLYETRKEVENTCRAMIASYNTDKQIYLQYKDADSAEQRGWAAQAKMRVNQTASTYNNYILKNSYVWQENVPSDIFMNLSFLE